jgi:hypothetical protein
MALTVHGAVLATMTIDSHTGRSFLYNVSSDDIFPNKGEMLCICPGESLLSTSFWTSVHNATGYGVGSKSSSIKVIFQNCDAGCAVPTMYNALILIFNSTSKIGPAPSYEFQDESTRTPHWQFSR